jgi:hypothetical protein
MKIRSKIDLYPHRYFTKHLMGVFFILESFDPTTQESYRLHPAQITINSGTEQLNADQNQNENDHQN